MDKLLDEYKNTLKNTRKEIRQVRANSSHYADADSYLQFLNWAVTNLQFIINHLDPKPKKRDIKKNTLDEITLTVDNNDPMLSAYDKYSHDAEDEEQIALARYKKKFVRELLQSLTKRQRDILDLSSRGFTHKEISGMLGCTRENITITLKTIHLKVKNEGWFMG